MPCFCLQFVLLGLVPTVRAADETSNNSRCSGRSSALSKPQAAAHDKQPHGESGCQQLPCSCSEIEVPAPIQAMLQQLGCSVPVALAAARLPRVQGWWRLPNLSLLMDVYDQYMDWLVGVVQQGSTAAGRQRPDISQVECPAAMRLHALMPGVLAQCAAHAPSSLEAYSRTLPTACRALQLLEQAEGDSTSQNVGLCCSDTGREQEQEDEQWQECCQEEGQAGKVQLLSPPLQQLSLAADDNQQQQQLSLSAQADSQADSLAQQAPQDGLGTQTQPPQTPLKKPWVSGCRQAKCNVHFLLCNFLHELLDKWRSSQQGGCAQQDTAAPPAAAAAAGSSACTTCSCESLSLKLCRVSHMTLISLRGVQLLIVRAVTAASADGAAAEDADDADAKACALFAVTAGRTCAALENLLRAEISLAQQSASSLLGEEYAQVKDDDMVVCGGPPGRSGPFPSTSLLAVHELLSPERHMIARLVDSNLAHTQIGRKAYPQMFGLLCGLLKVAACSSLHAPPAFLQQLRTECLEFTYKAAKRALAHAVRPGRCAAALPEEDADTQPQPESAGAVGTGSSAADAADAADVSTILPWVVLLGRCCFLWGRQLLAQQASSSAVKVSLVADEVVEVLTDWLQTGSTSAQLAAMGYDPELLLLQLQGLTAARRGLVDAFKCPYEHPGEAVAGLASELQSVGMRLASFPVSGACNNPSCSNVSGACEAELVGGRSCVCARCRTARYCCKSCQRQHWRHHKPVCQALESRASTATSSVAT